MGDSPQNFPKFADLFFEKSQKKKFIFSTKNIFFSFCIYLSKQIRISSRGSHTMLQGAGEDFLKICGSGGDK